MSGAPITSPSPAGPEPSSRAAVGQAAAALGLVVPAEDLEAVVAYVDVLRGFAAQLGDPAEEPAAVFRP
ncbi:MAG: hypothetical protein JWQ99_1491 [Blastococcus sp.]|jgi:hypothetical protein|nr:hypothetical protein [Blastococcus sp.]